jgi:hypothetical protein
LASVGSGLQTVITAAGQAGWLVSRATAELINALGFNEIEGGEADVGTVRQAYASLPSGGAALNPPSLPLTPNLAEPSPAPPLPPAIVIAMAREGPTIRDADVMPLAPRLGDGFVNDMPHKLPDGTLIVPKAAQRLYRLRTAPTEVISAPLTIKLDGVVIQDPSRGGDVQTNYMGRLEVGEVGMPHLGMRVTEGQVLAWLRPVLTPLERATLRNDIARLTGEIVLAEKRIERLGQFFFVPFREGKIVYERLAFISLQKQREALMAVLTERDPIRAPMSGTISAIHQSMGQVAAARETVFEIVDPDALWVEAVAYTHGTLPDIVAAAAATVDGTVIPLRFVGRGMEMKQHAVPLHFRVDARIADLSAGKPVRVVVQTAAKEPGIILPNESVVRTTNGVDIVWEKTGPETFVARHVSTRPLDATRLYVVEGLEADKSVVISSARLLSQFR